MTIFIVGNLDPIGRGLRRELLSAARAAGATFTFGLTTFGERASYLPYFIAAFRRLGKQCAPGVVAQ